MSLTPTPPLRFALNRLRRTAIERAYWNDPTILETLSDGYRRACERACIMPTIYQWEADGSAEYDLPADLYRVLRVFLAGSPLDEVPLHLALEGREAGYYTYEQKIGLVPTAAEGATAAMLYAATPPPLESFDEELDEAFGQEHVPILVHYARARVLEQAGGAQHITSARFERQMYEVGVLRLSQQTVNRVGPARIRTLHQRAPRRVRRDQDAG